MKTNHKHNPPRPRGVGWLSAITALVLIASHGSAPAQDTTPPTVVEIVGACQSFAPLQVRFSEPVNADVSNFALYLEGSPDPIITIQVVPLLPDTTSWALFFGEGWIPGTQELSIFGVTDVSLNTLSPNPARVPLTVECETTPPSVVSVRPNCDGTILTVTFTEPMNPQPMLDTFNYWVDGYGVLSPTELLGFGSTGFNSVDLYFSPPLMTGSHSLFADWNYLVDLSGNYLESATVPFTVGSPLVTCSVAVSSLFPVNNGLVNVGLSAASSEPNLQVQVFSDEPKLPALQDAELSAGILKLRARRNPGSDGRVYLIVVTSTDSCGNVGVCCSTVVVPKNGGAGALASVQAQAAAAQAKCSASGSPLTPYRILP